ncbi:MAG: flagellar hook-length control protein FliK [Fimbriimonadaceae bacterium]|nr:flagellar hook-length control protein FliK [Fimbriimonadaceae bacterium]
MSISPILMAMVDPTAAQAETSVAGAGFATAITSVQSKAPPGPEPPPGISAKTLPGEVGKTEPIAPFEELDLLATMKNLTEGFFDGAPIDAPMPSINPKDANTATSADANPSNTDVKLFLSAGAMAMAMFPTTTIPDESLNIAVAEGNGQSVAAIIDTAENANTAAGYTSKAEMMSATSKAYASTADANTEALGEKFVDPIELTDLEKKLLEQSKSTLPPDASLSKAEFYAEGNRVRKGERKPAEPVSGPIPKPEINPNNRTDLNSTQPKDKSKVDYVEPLPKPAEGVPGSSRTDIGGSPKGVSKSDYVAPMPKPSEEVKPPTGPVSKSDFYGASKTDETAKSTLPIQGAIGVEQVSKVEAQAAVSKLDASMDTTATSKAEVYGSANATSKHDAAQGQNGQAGDNPNASTKPNDPNATVKPGDPNSEYKRASGNASEAITSSKGVSRAEAFTKIEDVQPVSKTDASTIAAMNPTSSVQQISKAEAAKEVRTLDPVTTNHVIRQVADRLEALAAARPKNGVTIHLEPFDLGKITMTIKSSGHDVDAQISASNEAVRVALESNRPMLQQALDQRGINLVNVDVSGQTLTQDMPQRQQHGQMNAQSQPAPTWGAQQSGLNTTTITENRHYVAKATGGVNLWI